MPREISIVLDATILKEIDELVRLKKFTNHSKFIEEAVQEKLSRIKNQRLAQECSKLDPAGEKTLAEEGMLDAPLEPPA